MCVCECVCVCVCVCVTFGYSQSSETFLMDTFTDSTHMRLMSPSK